jgi:hypothetical protein
MVSEDVGWCWFESDLSQQSQVQVQSIARVPTLSHGQSKVLEQMLLFSLLVHLMATTAGR